MFRRYTRSSNWLVVSTPLKNISQWDDYSQNMENNKYSKPPTIYIYNFEFLPCRLDMIRSYNINIDENGSVLDDVRHELC